MPEMKKNNGMWNKYIAERTYSQHSKCAHITNKIPMPLAMSI